MARTKKAAPGGVSDLQADDGVTVPRIKLGEQGFIGLRTSNRQIVEEQQRSFRFPAFIKTINEMRANSTVGAAMNVYRMMLSRVKWHVQPPKGASEQEVARAAVVESMMHDMDGSWGNFIESVIPYLEYGFGINEKVFRRRLLKNGSKWNDGIVGLKSLPTRSQDTIAGWKFDETGAELLAVEQSLSYIENGYKFQNRANENGLIEIPREKFLLFSASANKGNPLGNSIYKNIFLSWKRLELLQDQELLCAAKDIQGILKIGLPPKYLDPNGSAEDKAVASAFQQIIDNYNAGTQRGLLVPVVSDPDTKLPMFTYDLMESKGSSKVDIEAIIKRMQGDILSALSVDILKLGADGTGSFSLAESKSSVLALAIDYRLKEIAEVLNQDLMRAIFAVNGWSAERLPEFVYSDIEEISLDELGKYLQRIKAVGLLEVDRPVLNRVREAMGVPVKDDDEEPDVEAMTLTDSESKSGKSLDTPTGGMNGTANSVSKGDNSAANKENAE